MSERARRITDDQLGRALTGALEWPPTPAIGAAVARRIEEAERAPVQLRPRLSLPSRRRTVLILVAAALAVATAAVAAKLVIDLGAITITEIPQPRSPAPSRTLGPSAFGTPVTLDQAAELAGFEPMVPGTLGEPDRVWVDRVADFSGAEVTSIVMAWDPRDDLPAIDDAGFGAVLIEFHGRADVAAKLLLADATSVVSTDVDGHDGLFITGPHELDLLADGEVRRFTVTGNVLLWNRGGLAFRLETGLSQAAAETIGESVAP